MSVWASFGAGKVAGAIFRVRGYGWTRVITNCPNGLITIAATVAEGNPVAQRRVDLMSMARGKESESTTDGTEIADPKARERHA
jgi:hypothetical protein